MIHTKKEKMEEILYNAYRCLNFNEMLIKQCDDWLSEEEGMKNMKKQIEEQRKRSKKEKRK
jgi:hypothetical protein